MKILKEAYVEIKKRIGRIPYQYDFILNYSIDPLVIAEKYKNYYLFLLKMKEEVLLIDSYENKVLTMFSMEILNGKRKNELILLKMLMEDGRVNYNIYLEKLKEANCRAYADTLHSVHPIYDLTIFKQTDQK